MKKTKIVEGLKTFCSTFFSFYRSADSDVTSVAVAYTQQKSKANQSSVFKPLSTNNWF
ncbi:hypothetical protein ACTGVT_10755 [Streptococcus suis]